MRRAIACILRQSVGWRGNRGQWPKGRLPSRLCHFAFSLRGRPIAESARFRRSRVSDIQMAPHQGLVAVDNFGGAWDDRARER